MNMPIAYLMKVSAGLGSQRPRCLGLEGRAPHFQGHKTAKQKDSCSSGTVKGNKKPTKMCVQINFLLILWETQV